MPSKEFIVKEIRRTADVNDGNPLGRQAFETQTGIKQSDWYGIYWSTWGEALEEAGFERNKFQKALPDEVVLRSFAELTGELGQIPTNGQIRIKSKNRQAFPTHNVFNRYGGKLNLVAKTLEYCLEDNGSDWALVVETCQDYLKANSATKDGRTDSGQILSGGYVYLIKSGRHYKIGMTQDISRRAGEIKIELPERSETVHVISTDDPVGIEAYWHNRFRSKRGNGEWFELDSSDVKAFRRRKFM